MKDFKLPSKVNVFEVGPRDGLQNEKVVLPLETKLTYIKSLMATGLKDIEVGAFVREDKIPQMANSNQIFKNLPTSKINFWALVPNEKGLDRALDSGCRAIAVFTGSTDEFTKNNIGMTVSESLKIFETVLSRAKKEKLKTRAYVSTAWGCPYEGKVRPSKPVSITKQLIEMGADQISLGDTIGVATPLEVGNLLIKLHKEVKSDLIAGHFHDTRGTALANCLAAMQVGVKTLDSSSAGLGGCNYAPGASGNVSTEDLLYMLNGLGIKSGVDLDKICEASMIAIKGLARLPASKFLQAWLASAKK